MIRIKTLIGNIRVYTLVFNGEWVTLYNINGKSHSLAARDLHGAGVNHLDACSRVQVSQNLTVKKRK